MVFWHLFRPAEFDQDNKGVNSESAPQIDDDMLPPSYSDSEEEGDMLVGAGNPNRPAQVVENSSEEESEESD